MEVISWCCLCLLTIMSFKITIDASQTIKALNAIVSGVPQAIDATLRRAAEEAAQGARSAVPVDTGALRDSIQIIPEGDNGIVIGAGDEGDLKYAVYMELGTSKMAAQPYMGPEADKLNSRLSVILAEELNKLL
jgi:HK97 gp10 family phage protein